MWASLAKWRRGVRAWLGRSYLEPQGMMGTVEMEFWGAMDAPNLMVESTPEEVADLVAATSFHVGEVARNPYHALLPAWLAGSVRRGAELVGGQGGAAPEYAFATLYRVSRWRDGALEPAFPGGLQLPSGGGLAPLLED